MTRDELRAYLDRRRQAWHSADAAALANDHAEDSTVSSPMFATVHGRRAIQESYEALFRMFTNWEYVHEEPLLDGDRLALPFKARATHVGDFMGVAGTGRRVEIIGVLLMELRDAQIVRERRMYDFTGLLIKTGVLRGKPV